MPLGADPLPTFTTARLGLRPRSLADLDECLAMDRDPLVTKFIHGPRADPIAHQAFVEARIRHVYSAGMGCWSIFASNPQFIGWILPREKKGKTFFKSPLARIFFHPGWVG